MDYKVGLTANEIVKNKFWIINDALAKIGTLSLLSNDMYSYYESSKNLTTIIDKAAVYHMFDFSTTKIVTNQTQLLGYPVPEIELFKTSTLKNVPIFTKAQDSKIYHAAGYYALDYPNNGWTDSFCPKTSTLEKYKWLGPFKTKADMNLTISRMCRAAK